jgi:hypothetical protein
MSVSDQKRPRQQVIDRNLVAVLLATAATVFALAAFGADRTTMSGYIGVVGQAFWGLLAAAFGGWLAWAVGGGIWGILAGGVGAGFVAVSSIEAKNVKARVQANLAALRSPKH